MNRVILPYLVPGAGLALVSPFQNDAALRQSADYSVVTDSIDPGGAVYSSNYSHLGSFGDVVGVSAHTITDGPTPAAFHGYVPQLEGSLFPQVDLAVMIKTQTEPRLRLGTLRYTLIAINNASKKSSRPRPGLAGLSRPQKNFRISCNPSRRNPKEAGGPILDV